MEEYTKEDTWVKVTNQAEGKLIFESNLNEEWTIKLLEFAVEELKKQRKNVN